MQDMHILPKDAATIKLQDYHTSSIYINLTQSGPLVTRTCSGYLRSMVWPCTVWPRCQGTTTLPEYGHAAWVRPRCQSTATLPGCASIGKQQFTNNCRWSNGRPIMIRQFKQYEKCWDLLVWICFELEICCTQEYYVEVASNFSPARKTIRWMTRLWHQQHLPADERWESWRIYTKVSLVLAVLSCHTFSLSYVSMHSCTCSGFRPWKPTGKSVIYIYTYKNNN